MSMQNGAGKGNPFPWCSEAPRAKCVAGWFMVAVAHWASMHSGLANAWGHWENTLDFGPKPTRSEQAKHNLMHSVSPGVYIWGSVSGDRGTVIVVLDTVAPMIRWAWVQIMWLPLTNSDIQAYCLSACNLSFLFCKMGKSIASTSYCLENQLK